MSFDMERRGFLTLLGGAAAWPFAACAQPVDRVRRIGVLMTGSAGDPDAPFYIRAFQESFEKLGWVVGRNFQVDYRWGAGEGDAATAAAREFLSLRPDVIVADGREALEALRHAALTIPVVFMEIDQPVFYGFVESLTHPGGNMTGFTGLEPIVGAKWLELLKETAPNVTRIAVIFNPRTAPSAALFSLSAEAVAQRLAVEVIRATVYEPTEIETVMTMLAREPGGGLILPIDAFTTVRRDLLFELAARNRLPAIYGVRNAAAAGGLVSYGIDLVDQLRQAAGYVDCILRGGKPSDLPVLQPTKFELVINLKTAKALGLEIPPRLLALADAVIK
jgi:putative ABC transport system substrate-binding protein